MGSLDSYSRSHESCEKHLTETAKAIIVVDGSWEYDGPCLLLGKEKCNEKYGLFWGQVEKWESPEAALGRELREEMFQGQQGKPTKTYNKLREIGGYNDQVYFHKKEKLSTFETNSHKVNLYAVSLGNNYLNLSHEHSWVQIYPLGDKYEKERKAIESNMEPYARIAVQKFRNTFPKSQDWEQFQSWIKWSEDVSLHKKAQEEKEMLLKWLELKNKWLEKKWSKKKWLKECKESYWKSIAEVLLGQCFWIKYWGNKKNKGNENKKTQTIKFNSSSNSPLKLAA